MNYTTDTPKQNAQITTDRLNNALSVVAKLVMEDEIYLPIFERLEAEIAAIRLRDNAFLRAKAIANGHTAIF